MNAFIRFKLALTEESRRSNRTTRSAWANLEDARSTPIETSLTLLDSLHDRWVRVLRAMSATDFARELNHPENGIMSLDQLLAMYDWHGRHHVAHITGLRQRDGRISELPPVVRANSFERRRGDTRSRRDRT